MSAEVKCPICNISLSFIPKSLHDSSKFMAAMCLSCGCTLAECMRCHEWSVFTNKWMNICSECEGAFCVKCWMSEDGDDGLCKGCRAGLIALAA